MEIFVRPFDGDETPGTLRRWAERIESKRVTDELIVVGRGAGKDLRGLFHKYLFAPDRELEAKGPHLEFANAKSDDELIQFINAWGPIAAPSVAMQGWSKKSSIGYWGSSSIAAKNAGLLSEVETTTREARENLRCVRGLQSAISAAVALLKTVSATKLNRDVALSAMHRLMGALGGARDLLTDPTMAGRYRNCGLVSLKLIVDCETIDNRIQIERSRGKVPNLRRFCWDMLCALFNTFPDTLVSTADGVLLAPAEADGILPLIVFMLRQDLVTGRRIIVCERCGDFLLQRRLGERGCAGCKDALRARRYYERKRKTILRRRKKKRRMKSRNLKVREL